MSSRRPHGRISALVLFAILVAVVAILATPAVAAAATLYVDVTRGNDLGGDGSIGRPYRTITKGLATAVYGDSVRVAAGTYSAATGEVFPLVLASGVHLRGDRSSMTMIPSLLGTVIDGDDTNTILRIVGGNESTVVDGIRFSDNNSPVDGGAIRIEGGNLPGGGPVVRNCSFFLTRAPMGGAIRIERGVYATCAPRIERCLMLNCVATGGGGGGISSVNAVPYLSDTRLLGCGTSAGRGGALSLEGGVGEAQLRDCMIFGSGSSTGNGGAVFCSNQNLALRETSIFGCQAAAGGGVAAIDTVAPLDATLLLENCVVRGCWATVSYGGAVAAASVATTVRSSTIISNTAAALGGGLFQGGQPLSVGNSILWGNDDDIALAGGSTLSLQYSCVEDPDAGIGVTHADPQLWDVIDRPRLLPDSPCIDAGNNTVAPAQDIEGRARPADGDRDGTAITDMGAFEFDPTVYRASGDDRYKTAVAASQDQYEIADQVVLATGMAYPDALCAASLAGVVEGPVLLTRPDALPAEVGTELVRLGTEKVYVVGGESAVSAGVVDGLEDAGYAVERLSGADRYATSRAVAAEVSDLLGAWLEDFVLIARGDAFPDALSASPVAAWLGVPILLTRPDALPLSTMNALSGLGFKDAIVVGGTSAVSDHVFGQLEAMLSGTVGRVSGLDRYDTSVAFAEFVDADPRFFGGWDHDYVGIATGVNFPDALCGGPICGARRGPLLLVQPTWLPNRAETYISHHSEWMAWIEVFGGSSAVSDGVLGELRALLP